MSQRITTSNHNSCRTQPNQWDTVLCGYCNAEMEVTRNVLAPMSWSGAMAGIKHLHDRFDCPNNGEIWHKQIASIREYQSKCPSQTLCELMDNECDLILATKKPTKPLI